MSVYTNLRCAVYLEVDLKGVRLQEGNTVHKQSFVLGHPVFFWKHQCKMGFSDKKWLKLTRIRDFKCYQPYWNMIQHQLSKKETFRSHTRTCKFAIWVLFNKKVAIESPFPTYKEIPKIIYISISGVYSWNVG